MLKKTALAAALLSLGWAASASYAQTAASTQGSNDQGSTLEPVVVTVTRTAVAADNTLSSFTVITREDIDRLQPTSAADLLTGLPGVSLSQTRLAKAPPVKHEYKAPRTAAKIKRTSSFAQ